jgi:mannose-1-phosphate guanylyltransferase
MLLHTGPGGCLKAFLLAAGNGTRLRPLTDTVPKCLLPIRGVPLLEIWLETCRRAGITEVLINLHAHAGLVRQYLRKNTGGIRVRISEEPQLLGSAGTLRVNQRWVATDSYFWILYADVLNCVDLRAMQKLHVTRRPAATLGVYRVPDPSRCGIVDVAEDGTINQFVEKPQRPSSNLAFSGLMIAGSELLQELPDQMPSDIGFDVLPRLIGRMIAFQIKDYLVDIGTMDNYLTAQQTWPGFHDVAVAGRQRYVEPNY